MSKADHPSNSDANSSGIPSTADRWFVLMKGQSVGPMSSNKILSKLIDGSLDVIHRVSSDGTNWAAICNTPYFDNMVESQIRIYSGRAEVYGGVKRGTSSDPSQVGEISQIAHIENLGNSITSSVSQQLEQARQLEEITANIQKLNSLLKDMRLKRKTVTHEQPKNEEVMHPDDQDVFVPAAKPPLDWRELFKGHDRFRKPLLLTFAIIALGFLGIEAFHYFTNSQAEAENRRKLEDARTAKAKGDYTSALASFKSIGDKKNLSADDLLEMADLYVQGGAKNSTNVKELLQFASSLNLQPQQKARFHNIAAIDARNLGDFQQAEVEFEQSLRFSEVFASLHNLGVMKIKAKKYIEGEKLLLKAIEMGARSATDDREATIISLFDAAVSLEKVSMQPTSPADANAPTMVQVPQPMPRLTAVLELIDSAFKRGGVKRIEELNLIRTLALFHVGTNLSNVDSFRIAAYQMIDTRPLKVTAVEQPGLDYDLAKLGYIARNCREIYNREKSNDFIAAFYAACLNRSLGADQALPFAKYAVQLRPKDPAYVGLLSALYIDMNMFEEAKALFLVQGPNGMVFENEDKWRLSKMASMSIDTLKLAAPPSAATAPTEANRTSLGLPTSPTDNRNPSGNPVISIPTSAPINVPRAVPAQPNGRK